MSLPDTVFIFILALIIFGPKKLPEMARQLGRLVGEFRRASNEFKFQIEEELRQAERSEPQQAAANAIHPPALEAGNGSAGDANSPDGGSYGDGVSTEPVNYLKPEMPVSLATLTAAVGTQPRNDSTGSILAEPAAAFSPSSEDHDAVPDAPPANSAPHPPTADNDASTEAQVTRG
jgi:sec-independent protein translocase protein TatB